MHYTHTHIQTLSLRPSVDQNPQNSKKMAESII